MTELQTMYCMIVLYMLNKVEHPLTNTQITNFILEKDYTNYFNVQLTLSELLSKQLITAESTHNNTRYRITEEGAQTLHFFSDKISPEIKEDVHSYFKEHQYELKQETSVYADYYKSTASGYQVHCHIKNLNTPVLDVAIAVSTKEQAKAICANWNAEHANAYAALMDLLLK